MKPEIFEIVKLVLQIILLIVTVFLVPLFTKWIQSNTTKEQRDNALFWIRKVTKIAEDIYKEKGQGQLKKEYVAEWLTKNGIKISEDQISVLIDMVVGEYNKNGWNL